MAFDPVVHTGGDGHLGAVLELVPERVGAINLIGIRGLIRGRTGLNLTQMPPLPSSAADGALSVALYCQ